MADHWGRWVQTSTILYPASRCAVTTITVWGRTWKRVRALRPDER